MCQVEVFEVPPSFFLSPSVSLDPQQQPPACAWRVFLNRVSTTSRHSLFQKGLQPILFHVLVFQLRPLVLQDLLMPTLASAFHLTLLRFPT